MILDRLALAGLSWTARAAVSAFRTERSRPSAESQAMPPPEVVRRRKKVSTERRLPQMEEAAARASLPPVETFDLVGPDADFVHSLQPDDFPSRSSLG